MISPAGCQSFLQPGHGLVHGWLFRADAAAYGVQLFQLLQVVSVKADAPHDHQRLSRVGLQTDGDAVGDGEYLALYAVGP